MKKHALFQIALGLLTAFPLMAETAVAPFLPPMRNVVPREFVTWDSLKPSSDAAAFPVRRSLNGVWKSTRLENSAVPFADTVDLDHPCRLENFDDSAWKNVPVPMNWFETSACAPGILSTQKPYYKGWYRTRFDLSEKELENRRMVLNFNCISHEAVLFVNGREVIRHGGDFTGFSVDVTDSVHPGKNTLAVRVRYDLGPRISKKKVPAAKHTYGCQWWYQQMKCGILDEVSLSMEPEIRVAKLLVNPRLNEGVLEVDYTILNPGKDSRRLSLDAKILSAGKADAGKTAGTLTSQSALDLKPGVNQGAFRVPVDKSIRLWECDDPNLYFLSVTLRNDLGTAVSGNAVRFGWREFTMKNGKFYLNGRPVFLFGCNPASVDFICGKSMPDPAARDRKIRKFLTYNKACGNNIGRTAHQPITPRFLELADEFGMMVFHEWSWCFTSEIEEPAFSESLRRELPEYVESSYNHPSVTMWCLGNEVTLDKKLLKISDFQVDLIRKLDRQNRPVSCQSGNFTGDFAAKTDILDYHFYTGQSDPWTGMNANLQSLRESNWKKYGKNVFQEKAVVAWELIGFSWGMSADPKFRRGNVDDYAAYMKKQFSWGIPNGIGFVGALPLFKALQGDASFAQLYYGHRIFELIRNDGLLNGYAPWFQECEGIPLWTQRVYPSLVTNGHLFPRNLFAGEKTEWDLVISNVGGKTFGNAELVLSIMTPQGRSISLTTRRLDSALRPFEPLRAKQTLALPEDLDGICQLRLVLQSGGREIGRNYYDLFVKSRRNLTAAITPARPVRIWKTGSESNVEALRRLLQEYGISADVISGWAQAPAGSLVIVPPELEKQSVTLPDSAISELMKNGGILLILEQHSNSSALPGNQMLFEHNFQFVDPVLPDHPVFAGMEWTQFDTWRNEIGGAVIRNYLMPYVKNALAVKGPLLLSPTKLGNAVLEAKVGAGRLLISQLEAVRSCKSDSAAAQYLRNLLTYASGKTHVASALPLESSVSDRAALPEARLCPIDLKPYANISFRDDGKGGWLNQGENDLRFFPTGRQKAAGVVFEVIDPARNQSRSAIALYGTRIPDFPEAVRGIPVNRKLARLYWMHTVGFADDGLKAGAYRIHYTDGTSLDYEMTVGKNCEDWWKPGRLPDAEKGLVCRNPKFGHAVGTFIAVWNNPHPEKTIASFDFLSAKAAFGTGNNWSYTKFPVPVLIAVTGERPEEVFHAMKTPGVRASFMKDKAHPEIAGSAKMETLDGRPAATVDFPALPSGVNPGMILFFRPEKSTAGYSTLRFEAKSSRNVLVKLVLPEKGWKSFHNIRRINLAGDGQWHTYTVDFNSPNVYHGGNAAARGENLSGEFFLYNRVPDTEKNDLPPVRISIRSLEFLR